MDAADLASFLRSHRVDVAEAFADWYPRLRSRTLPFVHEHEADALFLIEAAAEPSLDPEVARRILQRIRQRLRRSLVRRSPRLVDPDQVPAPPNPGSPSRALAALVQALDARQLRVFELRYLDGRSVEEIAERMGISTRSVGRVLREIREIGRSRLGNS